MHVSKRVLAFIIVGAWIVLPLVAQTDTTKETQTPNSYLRKSQQSSKLRKKGRCQQGNGVENL